MARISVNDFQVATSEKRIPALLLEWETSGVGGFTYSCHVPDGNGPIQGVGGVPEAIELSGDTITRGWSTIRGNEGSGGDVIRLHYIESKQLRKDTFPVIISVLTLMTQLDCTSSTPVSGHLY